MSETFKPGDKVAWTMQDKNVMAGEVQAPDPEAPDVLVVKRVDGSVCHLKPERARRATPEDILKACDFYTNLGRR